MKLRIAIPNKGRMKEPCLELLKGAGLRMAAHDDKALFVKTNNPGVDIMFVRVDDIPQFIEDGVADAGMIGRDVIAEKGARLKELLPLNFGRCSLVVAAREDSGIESVEGIKDGARIATKFVNSSRRYFKGKGRKVDIVELSGAVEIAPIIGLADAIVDLTSTGSTLKTHGLRVVDTILESEFVLAANRGYESESLDDMVLAIGGVVSAGKKKFLIANMPDGRLKELEQTSRGMLSPTVTKLDKPGWIAIQVVVDEKDIFKLIKKIKDIGGRDILVLPIERLVR